MTTQDLRWPPSARHLLAYFGAPDSTFSDQQIFEALRAGDEDGRSVADVCTAHGITVPMYCVWRQRYGRLSLDDVRRVRRRADVRARLRLAGAVFAIASVVVAAAAWTLSGRRAPSRTEGQMQAAHAESPARAAAETPADAPTPTRTPAPAAGPTPAPQATPIPATSGRPAVQVAAAPTRAEADRLVRRLADAGHPAFIVPVTVRGTELYRVRVGPFDSEADAETRARALASDGFPGAWVTR